MKSMNPHTKKYFWSATAGVVAYVLGLALMNHDLHPATAAQILTVISLPLFPAIVVSTAINLKRVKPHMKRYFWRFTFGMSAYVLGLGVANHIYTPQSPYKNWLILLPILPLIYVSFAIVRCVADSDEMWRKIYTEAMAFSGLATGFTCFSYLFLRDIGAPEFHPEWAFYLMWAYYGIGFIVSWRRYK